MFDNRTVQTISYIDRFDIPRSIDPDTPINKTSELCDHLEVQLVNDIPVKVIADIAAKARTAKYSFLVYLEAIPVTFALNSESEFAGQCKTLVAASALTAIHSISIQSPPWSLVGVVNTAYSSLSPTDVCQKIWEAATLGHIPPADQKEVLTLKRKYTLEVAFDGVPLTFKVDSKDQLVGQCLNLTDHFKQEVGKIEYKTKKGEVDSISSSGITVSEACRRLAKAVKF